MNATVWETGSVDMLAHILGAVVVLGLVIVAHYRILGHTGVADEKS